MTRADGRWLGRAAAAAAVWSVLAIGICRGQAEPKPKAAEPPAPVPAPAPGDLAARVDALMKSPGFEAGHWGMIVVDRKTGETVFEKNADQLFAPASVTKLFSTSAALAALGPDHRFQTPLLRRGEIDDKGVLQGDLVLLASGDLALGGRTSPDDGTLLFKDHDHTYAGGDNLAQLVPVDPLSGLDHLARGAKDAGIRAITGDVIVDDRLFDPAPSTGSGPSRVSPIVVNDNVVDVLVAPAPQAGQPATVRTVPASAFFALDSRVETIGQGDKAEIEVESVGPRRFTVRGKIPLGHKEVVRIQEIDEPAAFARALLLERLAARGVVVEGSPLGQNRIDRLPPREQVAQWPKVAQYTSPPFRDYIRVILKVSHNLHASSLPLLVAVGQGGRSLADGLKKQGEFLKGLGIPPQAVSFGGGAGGSRSDLATPRATVGLLRAIDSRPEAAIFEAALPIVGRDGTAAEHIAADSPARGHIRAKTGTYWVDNALGDGTVLTSKALAGYMETASGRPLAFALFVNNVPADGEKVSSSVAGKLLGAICEAVYLSDAGAKPAAAPEPPTPMPAAAAPAAAAAP